MATEDARAVQVVLTPEVFELFKAWVDRDLGGHVFRIPGLSPHDLTTYAIGDGRHSDIPDPVAGRDYMSDSSPTPGTGRPERHG